MSDKTGFDFPEDPRKQQEQLRLEQAFLEELRQSWEQGNSGNITPLFKIEDALRESRLVHPSHGDAVSEVVPDSSILFVELPGEGGVAPAGEFNERGNVRSYVLQTAENLVNGDRNVQYGDPKADFQRTADYLTVYLRGVIERNHGVMYLLPHDIGVIQMLLKISRLSWSPNKGDHYVDIAGYAACAADCAAHEYDGLS